MLQIWRWHLGEHGSAGGWLHGLAVGRRDLHLLQWGGNVLRSRGRGGGNGIMIVGIGRVGGSGCGGY